MYNLKNNTINTEINKLWLTINIIFIFKNWLQKSIKYDYICIEYLLKCINKIKHFKNINCIVFNKNYLYNSNIDFIESNLIIENHNNYNDSIVRYIKEILKNISKDAKILYNKQ